MTRITLSIALLTAMLASTNGFVSTATSRPAFGIASTAHSTMERETHRLELPYFVDIKDKSAQTIAPPTKKAAPVSKAAKKGGAVHKEGVLSPVVFLSKMVLGEEKLNKVRAKVISLHSDVIASFVDTSETALGNLVLKQLFEITDKNGSGTIDEDELKVALKALGFEWLQEKQIKGIFERADTDANGAIDLEEWLKEAPKTLRTNLIKLAKKNGGDMGLLV